MQNSKYMKYNLTTFVAVLLISMTACMSEEIEYRHSTDKLIVTATHRLPATKTTLTPNAKGVHVVWAPNDKIRFMQENEKSYTVTDLLLKEGAGSQTAKFEGTNFPNIPNASHLKYQAFYPATIEGNTPETWKENASYKGQIQKGYDNTDHLAAFDYLATQQVDNIGQSLEFMHLGLIFCFDITMPQSAESTPQSFTLTTVNNENTPTTEGGLFENCNQTKTSSITLNFQECTTTTPTFKAYMMCHCNIPAMQNVLATLTLQDGSNYTCRLTAQQIISSTQSNGGTEGVCYIIPVSEWEKTKNSIFNAATLAQKFTGSGTLEDPYVIESAENLKYLIEANNNFRYNYFSLETDITIQDDFSWTPIGTSPEEKDQMYSFSGKFNGNGHTIKGELKNSTHNTNISLFNRTNGATISNLNVHLNITNTECNLIGGIIANASKTVITNCHYNGNIKAGSITNDTYIGGIIADAQMNCQITQCTSRGNIIQNTECTQAYTCLGGLVGKTTSDIVISQCNNYANIKGGIYDSNNCNNLGGIIGKISSRENNIGQIEECINYGEIYGGSFKNAYNNDASCCCIGGIIGLAQYCRLTKVCNYGFIHAQHSLHNNFTGGIIGNIMFNEVLLDNSANYGEIIGNGSSKIKSRTGGLIGTISSAPCQIHLCHNAGNVSVITDTQDNPDILVGSYAGFITNNTKNIVHNCCSTAPEVIIKNAKGEIIPASQPEFYIGNGQPLTECPDNHSPKNN